MSDAKRLAAIKAVRKELDSFHTECSSILFPDGVPDDDEIDKLFQKTLQGTLTKSDAQKLYIVPPVDIRRLDDSLDASELLKAIDDLEQCYPDGKLPEKVCGDANKLRVLFHHPIQRRQVWQALRLTRPRWFPWIADEANRFQGIDLKRDRDKMGVIPKGMPFVIDFGFFGDGSTFPIMTTHYAIIDGTQWKRCPVAEPALLDIEIEKLIPRLRELKLINDSQTILWLGYQKTFASRCECNILKRPCIECPLKRDPKLDKESAPRIPSSVSPKEKTVTVWPPDDGWHFDDGEAAYLCHRFPIRGPLLKLLKVFVDSAMNNHRSIAKADLLDAIENGGANPGEDALRGYVSRLRTRLRDEFNIDYGSHCHNPIPSVNRGNALAYKLDVSTITLKNATPRNKAHRKSSAKKSEAQR